MFQRDRFANQANCFRMNVSSVSNDDQNVSEVDYSVDCVFIAFRRKQRINYEMVNNLNFSIEIFNFRFH